MIGRLYITHQPIKRTSMGLAKLMSETNVFPCLIVDLIICSCDARSGKMELFVEDSAFRTESQRGTSGVFGRPMLRS